MRAEGIQGAYVPRKRRRSGDGVLGVDGVRVWPDLVKRDFQPTGADELWCSDLKQIPTGEGVLHLASVLDCFSRRIVGTTETAAASLYLSDSGTQARPILPIDPARRRPADQPTDSALDPGAVAGHSLRQDPLPGAPPASKPHLTVSTSSPGTPATQTSPRGRAP